MLSFVEKGTFQDESGYNWDYYRDDRLDPNPDPNAFYIVPRPAFVKDDHGRPSISIITYQTDDADNEMGIFRFEVELAIPSDVAVQISANIQSDPTQFPGVNKPNFIPLAILPGCVASFDLTSNGLSQTFNSMPSNFGNSMAIFVVHLSQAQMQRIKAALTNTGGAFNLKYYLCVPARLQGVSASLSFNAAIAYQYQLTQTAFNNWEELTDLKPLQNLLAQSSASKTTFNWLGKQAPTMLEEAVTNWADLNITTLVKAEVDQIIAGESLQGNSNFDLSRLNSFVRNYAEKSIVNWPLLPIALLPSLRDLGFDIADFEQFAGTQMQVMAVSTDLPFVSNKQGNTEMFQHVGLSASPDQVYIESVEIIFRYSNLTKGNDFKLTFNRCVTVQTDFDHNLGKSWNLSYIVNYAKIPGGPEFPPLTNDISQIDSAGFTLSAADCGILKVAFDAQQAFNSEGINPSVMYAVFSYVPNLGGQPIKQVVKFTPEFPIQTLNSLQAFPINKGYNFQVTYVYESGLTYTAPLVQNQTSLLQIIGAADMTKAVNLMVFQPAEQATKTPLIKASINMWYEATVLPPAGFAGVIPTKQSPASYALIPAPDTDGNLFAQDLFLGLAIADQPLMYRAALEFRNSEEVLILPQPISNTQASILISATQRYFTLEISPAAIQWDSIAFFSIEVLISPAVLRGSADSDKRTGQQAQKVFVWNKGESGSKYLTIPIQAGNEVSYDAETIFIEPGQPIQKKAGTGLTDQVFKIPVSP